MAATARAQETPAMASPTTSTTRPNVSIPTGPQRAPRGPQRTCKTWAAEAAMRMLMNNLDPEVAEDPEQLDRLRRQRQGGARLAELPGDRGDAAAARAGRDAARAVGQAGGRVPHARASAPRVLIANSNLVGRWANWEHFRELEAENKIMFGQMTAGSWIYIGTQGILQGTYETFAAAANAPLRGRPARAARGDRRARRHGRRAAARGDHEPRRRSSAPTSTARASRSASTRATCDG